MYENGTAFKSFRYIRRKKLTYKINRCRSINRYNYVELYSYVDHLRMNVLHKKEACHASDAKRKFIDDNKIIETTGDINWLVVESFQ